MFGLETSFVWPAFVYKDHISPVNQTDNGLGSPIDMLATPAVNIIKEFPFGESV